MWFGSTLIVLTFLLIGVYTQYWHFLIVIGILGGMRTSFIFIAPVASVSYFFSRQHGAATSLALSGGSIGGVLFPLVLEELKDRICFRPSD
jgi:MFS family permease